VSRAAKGNRAASSCFRACAGVVRRCPAKHSTRVLVCSLRLYDGMCKCELARATLRCPSQTRMPCARMFYCSTSRSAEHRMPGPASIARPRRRVFASTAKALSSKEKKCRHGATGKWQAARCGAIAAARTTRRYCDRLAVPHPANMVSPGDQSSPRCRNARFYRVPRFLGSWGFVRVFRRDGSQPALTSELLNNEEV